MTFEEWLKAPKTCDTAVDLARQAWNAALAAAFEESAVVADEWALHYPTCIFPEYGTSVDCMSAAAMRHASEQIAARIRARGEGDDDTRD